MFQNLESSEFKRLKKHNKKKPAWVFEATRNKLPPLLLRFQIWLADNSGLWKTIGNQSLSIILEACPYRVVRGSTASPHSWHKWHPTRFVPHINWRKKRELTLWIRPAPGEMDEPSEQMRPLLRTVSTRLTQLTVRPPLHLCGSLSVFASCLPSSRGSTRDAWESDSARHHPAAAIVSRLLLLTRGTSTSCVQVSSNSQRKLSFKHVFFIEMCFPARFLTCLFRPPLFSDSKLLANVNELARHEQSQAC